MHRTPEFETALANRVRLFYLGAAAALFILMLLGFQQFYLHGKAYPDREIAAPVRGLVLLHGVGMTAWVMLFLTQSLLIVRGRAGLHRLLGKFGAVLAAGLVVLGVKAGIEAIRVTPPETLIWSLTPRQFLSVPLFNMLIFALFVSAGIANRRQADVHRPMMLLSMLAVYSAAISRIDAISDLYRGTLLETVLGPYFSTLMAGAVFLLIKCWIARAWDRTFAAGYIGLALADTLIIWLAKTPAWDRIAGFLLG